MIFICLENILFSSCFVDDVVEVRLTSKGSGDIERSSTRDYFFILFFYILTSFITAQRVIKVVEADGFCDRLVVM